MIAGADGYNKHVIVAIADSSGETRLELIDSFENLKERSEVELIVIDVPIGLPDFGPRKCDRLARIMIGKRRNSVFPAPIRPMLDATSYEDACRRRHSVEGKRCSKQLFGILPFIRSVDQQMTSSLQNRIREGHPGLSFTALAGQPMDAHKRKPHGFEQRRRLLRGVFPDIDDNIDKFGRRGAVTDILDAYVLLWSAHRLAQGLAEALPHEPKYDSKGLRAEIVF